jgi:hypothetical protein
MYLETRAGSVRRWPQSTTEPETQGLIISRFPLQPSGHLEFRFRGGEPLSAHSDILLQLAADAVDATLTRLLVPEAAVPEAASTLLGLSPTPSGARTTGARRWLATR